MASPGVGRGPLIDFDDRAPSVFWKLNREVDADDSDDAGESWGDDSYGDDHDKYWKSLHVFGLTMFYTLVLAPGVLVSVGVFIIMVTWGDVIEIEIASNYRN